MRRHDKGEPVGKTDIQDRRAFYTAYASIDRSELCTGRRPPTQRRRLNYMHMDTYKHTYASSVRC